MKKLHLLLAIATLSLMSCDPDFYYYFEFVNGTNSALIVELEGQGPMTIDVGEKRTIYTDYHLGNPGDYSSPEENILNMEIIIDNVQMPNSFWRREYWEYADSGKHNATYTLTITNELIEEILSTEE